MLDTFCDPVVIAGMGHRSEPCPEPKGRLYGYRCYGSREGGGRVAPGAATER